MSFSLSRSSGVAALLALGGLLAACSSGSDDASSSTSAIEDGADSQSTIAGDGADGGGSTTVTTPTEGGVTSWVPPAAGESEAEVLGSSDAPAMMLIQFAQAWEDGSWKSMASVADEPVVSTATEWYEKGAQVSSRDTTVDDLVDSCQPRADTAAWVCELRYGGQDSDATDFTLTIAEVAGAVRLTELVAGDATG